ncbi:MAG TPA: DNA repair protein RecO [Firmicutes bacterium]|nr:DNA repair protein RecO [Candidatus Fermentithermobacillaceae bacterium]
MLYQTEGIVLSSAVLGEHDRVIALLTLQKGLVRAVVRGARKPSSRLAAVTQPFSRADFQLYGRGSSLDRVIQVSLLDSHPGIVSDYAKVVYANYLAEIVSGLMPEHERNSGVYHLFLAILDALQEARELWTVARWAELRLLRSAGFMPLLDSCLRCGKVPVGTAHFSAPAGGVLCEECHAGEADSADLIPLSPGSIKTLSLIASSQGRPNVVARGQVRDEAARVMREYVAHVLGKRPKSLSLVERLEDEGA